MYDGDEGQRRHRRSAQLAVWSQEGWRTQGCELHEDGADGLLR